MEIPVLPEEPDFEMQILPEDPEVVTTREGVNKRILAELYHETKAAETMAAEKLEASPL